MQHPLLAFGSLSLALGGLWPAHGAALELAAGDILVTTRFPAAVLRVDPVDGTQTVVTSGGQLNLPSGIALEPGWTLVVADAGPLQPAVIRVDPSDGSQSVVSSGGELVVPVDVEVEADGQILVSSQNLDFGGKIVRIDPQGGGQTVVTTFGVATRPGSLALDPNGDILVTDDLGAAVTRVDAQTGVQTPLSSGGLLSSPIGIDVSTAAFVADFSGLVIRVELDPPGTQTPIASGGNLSQPFGIGIESSGDLIVSDQGGLADIVRITPGGSQQVLVPSLASVPFHLIVLLEDPPTPLPTVSGWGRWLAAGALLAALVGVGAQCRSQS